MKKLISILLLTAMLITSVVSCSKSETNMMNETTTESSKSEETTAANVKQEYDRAHTPDDLPTDLNYNGQTIRMLYRGDSVIRDYQMIGENNGGDILYDAVYARNVAVSDRLNVKFEFIEGDDPDKWGNEYKAEIEKVILSGDSAWDIVFMSSQFGFEQVLNGYHINLIEFPHINYDQPWWWNEYMDSESIDTSKRYMLNGDITLQALMSANAAYFNKNMFTDLYGDHNTLYQTVRDGKWTFDKYYEYCTGAYNDVNGDGIKDDADVYGTRHTSIYTAINYTTLSNGLSMQTRDADGLPILNIYTEEWVKWTEMLVKYIEGGEASKISSQPNDITSESYFINKGSLFHMGMLYEAKQFRDTDFNYGIVAFPKMKEELNYVSAGATPNADSIFIPVTTNPELYDACGAALEALCAESYRTITETYYETTLKGKYLENTNDIEMVDLIYKNIGTCFVMVAGTVLGKNGAVSSMFVNVIKDNKGNLTSYYEKNKVAFDKYMADMIEKYKSLEY